MSNKFLFLTLLLGSFLISNLFWFGPIDQDYFSYYYVGQGTYEGYKTYGDFADNKGPVLYAFFAILALVFNQNYDWALITGSTFLDAFSVFIIFKILERDFKLKWFRYKILNLLTIIFCLALYKSFGMGYSMGGLYSENLGMLLLVLGYWVLGSKRYISSGIFFSLSILTRLSFLAFAPLFLVEFIFNKKDRKKLFHFILGGLIPLAISFIYFFSKNDFAGFFSTNFNQNTGYLSFGKTLPMSILFTSIIETRIFLIFIICIAVLILTALSKKELKEKAILVSLFIGSTVSAFAGGVADIFYYHHFFQFNFMALVTISLIISLKTKRDFFIPLLSILAFFILVNYYFFIISGRQNPQTLLIPHPKINEVSEKKYLMVVPHYPMYYFIYNKKSPDRYFQYFLLSDYFYKDTSKNINKHLEIKNKNLSDTAFLFVEKNVLDKNSVQEYKNNFGKEFNLKKVNTYHDLGATIEIYESSEK